MRKVIENKKLMLGVLTMVVILAIVVVSSFFPFILDPSKIGTREFLTDQLIIAAITISATVSMMFIAQVGNAQNPNSELAKAKVEFIKSMARITNHTVFFQWIKRVLQVKDKQDIAEKEMARLGIDFAVYNLTNNEIKELTKPQKYGDKFFKSLTKEQIKSVLKLKKEVATIRFVSPSYYTSFKSMMSDKNLSQIASGENKKKIYTVLFQLSLKIILSFVFSAILASLVRDLTQDGGMSAQSWMRFLSRIFAYISSSFLGYMVGCKMNDLDAFYISKRIEAHTLFTEDKDFKYEDEAKLEFMERVRNEGLLIEMKKGDKEDEKHE